MSDEDLSHLSMLDLFRLDAETQLEVLTASLIALERDETASDRLEACMRAAHSLKGAARIINLSAGVTLAHALEDCFVAAQGGRLALNHDWVDLLLSGVDLLGAIARTPEHDMPLWDGERRPQLETYLSSLTRMLEEKPSVGPADDVAATGMETAAPPEPSFAPVPRPVESAPQDRMLRVNAESLNRLLGLAGEARVASGWLGPISVSLLRLKRLQSQSGQAIDALRDVLSGREADEVTETALAHARRLNLECQQFLAQRLDEIETFDRRSLSIARRLYDEALACRMRPFADGVQGFSRMVRDVGRSLGKRVRLEITGLTTPVDRDILEQLDAPLGHLLRNAVDHGIESPEERRAAGKPAEGVVQLEARHGSGRLQVIVSDDGRGIDLHRLRATVVERRLTTATTAAELSESELLEFLFLPGFTLKGTVTEISGRGVGLDVVQDMLKRVRGQVRVTSAAGGGSRFQLQLPLTLSVVRTLLVEIGAEPYGFPLSQVVRTLRLPTRQIAVIEGRQHFEHDGRHIGLVTAHQILGYDESRLTANDLAVVVVSDAHNAYGLVVDRFLGERELVVQPLDPRLGKIKDVSAGALLEDGTPVLIVDVEDMIRSVEKLLPTGRLAPVQAGPAESSAGRCKRVLVVDDSLTVRELERKLLVQHAFEVEVAVDGMDGWNAVRTGHFDLVITDIDMPRMDGIELVTLIKRDLNLKHLPVIIVSYKDREEDRRRGLDAGADYYLTKGSFHDESLAQAVIDLIGEGGT